MVAGDTAKTLDVPSGGTSISSIPHKVGREKENLSEQGGRLSILLLAKLRAKKL